MLFNLVPIGFCACMRKIKLLGICFSSFFLSLVLFMGIIGVIRDIMTLLIFIVSALVLSVILLYPGIAYEKTSQSKVEFATDRIRVIDNKGRCWREIAYESITNLSVEQIADFFYGRYRETFVEMYICFFLNDVKDIPKVAYNELFSSPDFFIMGYQEDALNLFQNMYKQHNITQKEGVDFLP